MKVVKIIAWICITILVATVFAGLLTLGHAFDFESFKLGHWAIFMCYYTLAICGGIILAEE